MSQKLYRKSLEQLDAILERTPIEYRVEVVESFKKGLILGQSKNLTCYYNICEMYLKSDKTKPISQLVPSDEEIRRAQEMNEACIEAMDKGLIIE